MTPSSGGCTLEARPQAEYEPVVRLCPLALRIEARGRWREYDQKSVWSKAVALIRGCHRDRHGFGCVHSPAACAGLIVCM
jgi:hypothetical protein